MEVFNEAETSLYWKSIIDRTLQLIKHVTCVLYCAHIFLINRLVQVTGRVLAVGIIKNTSTFIYFTNRISTNDAEETDYVHSVSEDCLDVNVCLLLLKKIVLLFDAVIEV